MNKSEFNEWGEDLANRMPSTGEWLFSLPPSTREVWFEDVFSNFELQDAIAANRDLMASGGVKAYDRENLPAIMLRKIQEWHSVRTHEEERKRSVIESRRWRSARDERKRRHAQGVRFDLDSKMTKAVDDLFSIRVAHAAKHGVGMTEAEFRAAADSYWEGNDI